MSSDLISFFLKASKPELEAELKRLQDIYYNSNLSQSNQIISDKVYDDLIKIYENRFGEYKVVGAAPRDLEKETLPIYMGSLKKVRTEKEINNYMKKYPDHSYILMDKIDGSSILDTPDKAITRGGGGKGTNVTRIKQYIYFPEIKDELVRGELTMKKATFESKYASQFENSRNIINGFITAKNSFDPERVRDLSFLAYRYIDNTIKSQSEQLQILKSKGFQIPWYTTVKPKSAAEFLNILTKTLDERKINGEYEIDGIVIYAEGKYDFNDDKNPDHSISYKGTDISEITEVEYISWEPSKGKLLKPVVKIKEVLVDGAKVNWVTGHNAKWLVDRGIDTGAIVEITRRGRVIPHIEKVVESVTVRIPEGAYWSESGIELMSDQFPDEVMIKLIHSFFKKLEGKFLGEKTIEKIYNSGYVAIHDFINLKLEDALKIPTFKDASATRIIESIKNCTTNADISLVLAASNVMGEGFGARKFKNILDNFPEFLDRKWTEKEYIDKLQSIGGFDATAIPFAKNRHRLNDFIELHPEITYNNDPRVQDNIVHMEDEKYEEDELKNEIVNPEILPIKRNIQLIENKIEVPVSESKINIPISENKTLTFEPPKVTVNLVPQIKPKVIKTGLLLNKSIVFTGGKRKDLETKIVAQGGFIKSSVTGNTDILVVKDFNEVKGKFEKAEEINSKTPGKIEIIGVEDFESKYF
jgi:DNA ligase (NAD+)